MSSPPAAPSRGPTLSDPVATRRTAVSGVVWSVLGVGASQLLRLASNIALSYLLFRSAFGVMALVNVFLQGLEMFSDLGIWRSVARNARGTDPAFLNTAYTIQAIRGLFLWGVCSILAWPYASHYDEPMLVPYLIVTGIVAVLNGILSPSLFVLRRQVSIATITKMELAAQALSSCTMITWAAISPSVWALVAGSIAGACFQVVASHTWLSLYRPRFQWDRAARQEVFGLGKWMFLSSMITFLFSRSDRLVLGSFVSKEDLGLYSIALSLCGIVSNLASRLFDRVLFPFLSRKQHDIEAATTLFLAARRALLEVCACSCSGMVIAAPLFFDWFYDDRYIESGWYAQWITLSTWCAILTYGVGYIPLALGNSRVEFIGGVIRMLGVPLGIYGFQFIGLPGMVTGYSLASVCSMFVLTQFLPTRRWAVVGQSLFYTAVGAAYAGASILTVHWLEGHSRHAAIALTLTLLVPPGTLMIRRIRQHMRASRAGSTRTNADDSATGAVAPGETDDS